MANRMLIISLFLVAITFISAYNDDLITNLPDYPYKGRQFSGYLDLDNPLKKLHYVFAESQSDTVHDPLILWFNGGPGCSSMLAWSQEHGPAIFGTESTVFSINPHSWNKHANVLYIESPAGVGYSYVDSTNDDDWYVDDVQSGRENLQALISFFTKYPQYKNNDFYISGESYAGIYVPYLAYNVIKYNEEAVSSKKINIKGMIVGNGVTDWNVDTTPALYELAFTHAIYGPELRKNFLIECTKDGNSARCGYIMSKIDQLVAAINIYDIYRKCYGSNSSEGFTSSIRKTYKYTPWLFKNLSIDIDNQSPRLEFLSDYTKEDQLKDTPPCTDSVGPDAYFNRDDVRQSLHISDKADKWGMCSTKVEQSYHPDTAKGSYYLYKDIIGKIKILIYSGNTDAAVPINGTRRWIKNLNLNVVKPSRSWYSGDDSDLSGWVVKYDGLMFVTVRGTGHMVPQWKPKEALHMIESFLADRDL